MADRFTTAVKIGGPLNLELLQDIIGEAVSDGFSIDWEGSDNEAHLLRECLKKIEAGDKELEFNDHKISNDLLESFTGYLTEKDVPWTASVDAKYEYDGEFRWWLPGMETTHEVCSASCDCDGPVANLPMLEKWQREGWDLKKVIEFLQHIPPELPQITWTGPMTTTDSEKTG